MNPLQETQELTAKWHQSAVENTALNVANMLQTIKEAAMKGKEAAYFSLSDYTSYDIAELLKLGFKKQKDFFGLHYGGLTITWAPEDNAASLPEIKVGDKFVDYEWENIDQAITVTKIGKTKAEISHSYPRSAAGNAVIQSARDSMNEPEMVTISDIIPIKDLLDKTKWLPVGYTEWDGESK